MIPPRPPRWEAFRFALAFAASIMAARVWRDTMKKITLGLLLLALLQFCTAPAWAGDNDDEARLKKAADVLGEIINIPDNIPQDLIDKAECVIVLPSVKKFAIGFGGNYGKGAMICRSGAKFDGPWGAPG